MFKHLVIVGTLFISTFVVENQLQSTPYQVTGSDIASSSVSNSDSNLENNPKGGYVVRKFKSDNEQDASKIQHSIEGMIHRMSSNTYNRMLPIAFNKQGVESEGRDASADGQNNSE
ncbi:hypothetical protein K7432_013667 [Basidiobolus ranarum]|uniref:Uncharacterized protein n=1 Tax=Basidiobolus ranarum TaxID=34480 RepID=A0ABR2VQH1_9FUNG